MSRFPRVFLFLLVLLLLPPANSQTISTTTRSENVGHARAILREGLESKDYLVRIEAVRAAGMVGRNESVVSKLALFLDDKNVDVRLATVNALADLHDPQAEHPLLKVLRDDKTPEVSFAAAKSLAVAGDPAGIGALKEVYQGTRKSRSSGLKEKERHFVEQFHSAPSAMMFVVGEGVGYVPVPGAGEGFTAITSLLKEPGLSDRASVLFILAKKRTPESQELLRGALQDADWSVRASAAQLIAHTAQTALLDSLPRLFDDKNQKVRFRAAGAYLHLLLAEKVSVKGGS
jgi:HEAT repeat protein